MPPTLALMLCTTFVACLLYIDHRQAQGTTIALWIPTLWMLVICSKPLSYWFGGGRQMEEIDVLAGSPMDRLFLLIISAAAFLILLQRRADWRAILKGNIWLIVLILYMMISLFWSEISYTSLKRWIREIIALLMFLFIMTEPNPAQALLALFRRTIYILIPYSLVLIQYFSYWGRMYGRWSGEVMWVGATLHKNTLARLCAFTLFFTIWTLRYRRRRRMFIKYQAWFEIAVAAMALYMFAGPNHTLTYSATSFISLVFGLLVYFTLLLMKKQGATPYPALLTIIALAIIFYGIATPFIGGLSIIDPSSMVGRNENLTGRTDIWSALIPFAVQKFIFGHGYGGFWTPENMENALEVTEAHNGYLDIILDLGFVGLAMMTILITSYNSKALKFLLRDDDWATFFLSYTFMVLIYNVTEASLSSLTNQMSATFFFLAVFITSRRGKLILP